MIIIYIVMQVIYLSIVFRKKNSKAKSILYKLGTPISENLSKDMLHKLISKAGRQHITKLYPKNKWEKTMYEYQTKRIGLLYLVISIFILLALVIGNDYMPKHSLDYVISRPTYGNGEKKYIGIYTIDSTSISGEIPLVIEEQLPEKVEAEKILVEYKGRLEHIFLGKNIDSEKITKNLVLPKRLEELTDKPIYLKYKSLTPDYLTNEGEIRSNLMKEGEYYPVSMEVIITYGEGMLKDIYHFKLYKEIVGKKSIEELIKEGIHIESDKIHLPSKIALESGVIIWEAKEEGTHWSVVVLLGILSAMIMYIYMEKELSNKVKKRKEEILLDFPNMVSKLTLLIGAGMTLQSAWYKIIKEYQKKAGKKRPLYEEMIQVITDLGNGISESDALEAYGKRCRRIEVVRLSSILIQNLKRGSQSMNMALTTLSREAWDIRASTSKQLGEKASTKLLIPMGIGLLTVLLIVITPIFMTMKLN